MGDHHKLEEYDTHYCSESRSLRKNLRIATIGILATRSTAGGTIGKGLDFLRKSKISGRGGSQESGVRS
ncbi:hypothetical protein V0288_20465 [Pannus brasiliensis CCIBt3594]|uniref:Uncharacterized protein n=1 Tax=Pannus brasiliensis CCIBt3594 TaxID=1427578 RepID=A0AAW9QR33_9CHRO